MIIISPAKRQNHESQLAVASVPVHLDKTQVLLKDIEGLSLGDTKKALHISSILAAKAYAKNQALCDGAMDAQAAIAALGMYCGDVYKHLDVATLSQSEMYQLTTQLEKCSQPHTCPHGRPTMIHMSTERLEKEFGRK